MKLTFNEEQFIKGVKNLIKYELLKEIEIIKTDSEDLREVKVDLLNKLNKCTQVEIEDLIMSVD